MKRVVGRCTEKADRKGGTPPLSQCTDGEDEADPTQPLVDSVKWPSQKHYVCSAPSAIAALRMVE